MTDTLNRNQETTPRPVSTCPSGETFQLPTGDDYEKEYEHLKKRVEEQRTMGREIVVVMGVGFCGSRHGRRGRRFGRPPQRRTE